MQAISHSFASNHHLPADPWDSVGRRQEVTRLALRLNERVAGCRGYEHWQATEA
jgi:hypothetical protein